LIQNQEKSRVYGVFVLLYLLHNIVINRVIINLKLILIRLEIIKILYRLSFASFLWAMRNFLAVCGGTTQTVRKFLIAQRKEEQLTNY
jgi:hypothetical protein